VVLVLVLILPVLRLLTPVGVFIFTSVFECSGFLSACESRVEFWWFWSSVWSSFSFSFWFWSSLPFLFWFSFSCSLADMMLARVSDAV
jgi:hypothetical protein